MEQACTNWSGVDADFDDLLLTLHDPAAGLTDPPDAALAALDAFVPHRAAWLGHGAIGADGVPQLLSQTRRNLPGEFPDHWFRLRRLDPLAAQLGAPGDHALMTDGPDLPAPLRRFLAEYGIGKALCVTTTGLFSEGFMFLSLYRPATAPDFAPTQIRRARLFIRHLGLALRNRMGTGLAGARALSAAVTLQGRLEHASPALLERLRAAGVALSDMRLPPDLMRRLVRRGAVELGAVDLGAAHLRLDAQLGLSVLTLSDPPALLSMREAQVAHAYAAGLGFRQIAAELGISPHTARNHIGAIFRKLGVGSKLELAARLRKTANQ